MNSSVATNLLLFGWIGLGLVLAFLAAMAAVLGVLVYLLWRHFWRYIDSLFQ